MAQDIKADWYTVVLLEGAIPPFSENTDKETVRVMLSTVLLRAILLLLYVSHCRSLCFSLDITMGSLI